MTKPLIEIVDSRSFGAALADEIVMLIQDSIDEHGTCCIALAGGSTPSSTYRLLGRPPHAQEIDWSKVHLFWGDERWVKQDDTQSNYRMTRETLIDHVSIPAENVHAVNTLADSPEEAANEYAATIQSVARTDEAGLSIFDLVLLGIGDDGHTASLFPGSPALSVGEKEICVATTRPDGAVRITLTPAVLKAAKNVVFMVSGESKAEVIQTVLEGPQDIEQFPATLFRSMTGRVAWFVDTAAAKRLEKEQAS
jgi:6-phosphogluconolactonase